MLCFTLEFWGFTSDWHPLFQIPNSSPVRDNSVSEFYHFFFRAASTWSLSIQWFISHHQNTFPKEEQCDLHIPSKLPIGGYGGQPIWHPFLPLRNPTGPEMGSKNSPNFKCPKWAWSVQICWRPQRVHSRNGWNGSLAARIWTRKTEAEHGWQPG